MRPRRYGKTAEMEAKTARLEQAGVEVTKVGRMAQRLTTPDAMVIADRILPGPDGGTKELPTKPYDQLLWRAYVAGADWGDGAAGEGYPDWDDASYYEATSHGQAMLGDFYALLEEFRPKQVEGATLCSLGRPLRDHVKRCHPECTWKKP